MLGGLFSSLTFSRHVFCFIVVLNRIYSSISLGVTYEVTYNQYSVPLSNTSRLVRIELRSSDYSIFRDTQLLCDYSFSMRESIPHQSHAYANGVWCTWYIVPWRHNTLAHAHDENILDFTKFDYPPCSSKVFILRLIAIYSNFSEDVIKMLKTSKFTTSTVIYINAICNYEFIICIIYLIFFSIL